MSGVTQIFCAIEQGNPQAAEQLLPLVYNELRELAAQKLAHEKPGQTLQATALVHEAYLRPVDAGLVAIYCSMDSAAIRSYWASHFGVCALCASCEHATTIQSPRGETPNDVDQKPDHA